MALCSLPLPPNDRQAQLNDKLIRHLYMSHGCRKGQYEKSCQMDITEIVEKQIPNSRREIKVLYYKIICHAFLLLSSSFQGLFFVRDYT